MNPHDRPLTGQQAAARLDDVASVPSAPTESHAQPSAHTPKTGVSARTYRHAPDKQSGGLHHLLGVHEAAEYLGLSHWTVREMVNAGTIPRVRFPVPGDRDMRRILIDRADLDRLIERSKL